MGVPRIIFFALSLGFLTASSEDSDFDQYTAVIKGLGPLKSENEYLEMDYRMTIVDRYTAYLSGKFTALQNLGPVGLHVEFLKEPGFGQPYPAPPNITLPKVCYSRFNQKSYLEKFTLTAAINIDNCTIAPGNYQLSNFTIEPFVKKVLGKHLSYGDFILNVTIFGKPDGENELTYANLNLTLSIVNKQLEDQKQANRWGINENEQEDHRKEDRKSPGTWNYPDQY